MDDSLPLAATALEQQVRLRAQRAHWSLVPSETLTRTDEQHGIAGLVASLPGAEPRTTSTLRRLPEFRRAFELTPASVRLLICGLDHSAPDESYAAALWWTGLVRLDLAPLQRGDLHLFLVAPLGTADDSKWQGLRSEIESDERFCRKFVWLRSNAPSDSEIAAFLDRTFLAEPWAGKGADPTSLDPLEALIGDSHQSELLTAEEARLWVNRLGSVQVTGIPQLADDLVAILEGKR